MRNRTFGASLNLVQPKQSPPGRRSAVTASNLRDGQKEEARQKSLRF